MWEFPSGIKNSARSAPKFLAVPACNTMLEQRSHQLGAWLTRHMQRNHVHQRNVKGEEQHWVSPAWVVQALAQ